MEPFDKCLVCTGELTLKDIKRLANEKLKKARSEAIKKACRDAKRKNFDIRKHIIIHCVLDEEKHYGYWMHTHWMSQFNKPEIEIFAVPDEYVKLIGGLINDIATYLAKGAEIKDKHTVECGEFSMQFKHYKDSAAEEHYGNLGCLAISSLLYKGEKLFKLPPRAGAVAYCSLKERQPALPPPSYKEWQFWGKEIVNASLLQVEGISLRHLERAVKLAEKCIPEDDRTHPKVGAVVVKDGKIVSDAYRNEDGMGGHAEQIAIEKCKKEDLKGATVITTLEPCTTRGHASNRPCAEMLLHYGIKKVLIGVLDPNLKIRGDSEILLRQNNIIVGYFPSFLSLKIWELNKSFIKEHTKDEFRTVYVYDPSRKKSL